MPPHADRRRAPARPAPARRARAVRAHRDASGRGPRRRPLLVVALLLGGLLVTATAGVAGFVAWLDGNVDRIDDPFAALDEESRPGAAPTVPGQADTALNVLVLGADGSIDTDDPAGWQQGGQRTDAIMIVHVAADRRSAVLLSVPRDSWVDIPGHGQGKINAAFAYGGPTLMVETVEQLTGIRIDHVAVADFESFITLTDVLGGVDITVPEDTYQHDRLLFSAGTHHMDGAAALAYTRQRYGLPGGDLDRVKRQQNWMRSILTTTLSEGTLSDPVRLTRFLTTVTGAVAVDETLGLGDMRRLGASLSGLRADDVTFLTVPTEGTGRSPDGTQSIVALDAEALAPLAAAVADDTVADLLATEDGLDVLEDSVS
ncbi:LCP family protein [Sanguibacter suaedae]|uniref:LCP family protein n=1 Tax=Sanguibacter suaedae TaxID=2795737 RepID=UPI0027DDE815|nr:LCP family protein [Sanguibacter suaedae]